MQGYGFGAGFELEEGGFVQYGLHGVWLGGAYNGRQGDVWWQAGVNHGIEEYLSIFGPPTCLESHKTGRASFMLLRMWQCGFPQ